MRGCIRKANSMRPVKGPSLGFFTNTSGQIWLTVQCTASTPPQQVIPVQIHPVSDPRPKWTILTSSHMLSQLNQCGILQFSFRSKVANYTHSSMLMYDNDQSKIMPIDLGYKNWPAAINSPHFHPEVSAHSFGGKILTTWIGFISFRMHDHWNYPL